MKLLLLRDLTIGKLFKAGEIIEVPDVSLVKMIVGYKYATNRIPDEKPQPPTKKSKEKNEDSL